MRFTFPDRKSIDGIMRRISVEVMVFSSQRSEILDEILAVMMCLLSPEISAPAKAGRSLPFQETTLLVLPKAPHPDNMLMDSRRLVLPLPFGPRIRLIPGSQLMLSSG